MACCQRTVFGVRLPPREEQSAWVSVAWPTAASFVLRCVCDLTDLIFLGHLRHDSAHPAATSTSFLAAAALSLTWITASRSILDGGFDAALQTLAAQAHGARNHALMRTWLLISLACTTVMCVPIALSWAYTGAIVQGALGKAACDDTCRALVDVYSTYSIVWLWPSAVYSQLNSYLQVRLVVLPQLAIAALGAGVNVVLNWYFIYHAGMGFRGSPLATTSTRLLLLLALGGWWWCADGGSIGDPGRKAHDVKSGNDEPVCTDAHEQGTCIAPRALSSRVREFAKLCGPLALGNSLEEWQVQLIGFFAGALGQTAVATHNGMLQVFFVLTSIQWGILKATQVRVGHCLGRGQPLMAKRVTAFAFIVSFAVGVAIALLLVLLRNDVGHLFSSSPAVWHSASEISWMVGVGYVGLSIFFVAMAALSAQGRGGAHPMVQEPYRRPTQRT